MNINASSLDFQELNKMIKHSDSKQLMINNCLGQRYLGSGLSRGKIQIHGTPGNALGAYLDGADITVYGNAQDSIGDTMNEGSIFIHGSCGDTAMPCAAVRYLSGETRDTAPEFI
jgi:glutamate synthase domain-containing protein 3